METKIKIKCDYQISETCKKEYMSTKRNIRNTLNNNNGKMICLNCSRKLKNEGNNNANNKYIYNRNLFKDITEDSAYLLGWIASDGNIGKQNSIVIKIHKKDIKTLQYLRDIVCKDIPIKLDPKEPMIHFNINSKEIIKDICILLSIQPGKKSDIVKFPILNNINLINRFIQGYFEGDGHISDIFSKKRSPRCSIVSSSKEMLLEIKNNVKSPCSLTEKKSKNDKIIYQIEWNGINALDFCGEIYKNSIHQLERKYDLYLSWSRYIPALHGSNFNKKFFINETKNIFFKVNKTDKNAFFPSKSRISDSGYDLTLIKKIESNNYFQNTKLEIYDTGIKVIPPYGYYFDLIPRSSIIKTGYILANSVGVIDRGYIGNILVPLLKINLEAKDLELPIRLVQLILRPIVHVNFVEISIDEINSDRKEKGFGSSGNL